MPLLRSWISHPREHEPDSPLRRIGVPIVARTLGEALNEASRLLDVRFEPHDPPKWFRLYGIPSFEGGSMLVDIHIKRGDVELCPKQDLNFPILDSDVVYIYITTC